MRKGGLLFVLGLPVTLVTGCFMHTVVGPGNGDPSPISPYTFYSEFHGAPRHAFIDRTKKRVYVWIMAGSTDPENTVTRVFHKKYIFTAGDLCSDTRWLNSNEVTMLLYDFGDGVNRSTGRKSGLRSNHVATLSFILDKTTASFVEKK
jgi:hypothetical protein